MHYSLFFKCVSISAVQLGQFRLHTALRGLSGINDEVMVGGALASNYTRSIITERRKNYRENSEQNTAITAIELQREFAHTPYVACCSTLILFFFYSSDRKPLLTFDLSVLKTQFLFSLTSTRIRDERKILKSEMMMMKKKNKKPSIKTKTHF